MGKTIIKKAMSGICTAVLGIGMMVSCMPIYADTAAPQNSDTGEKASVASNGQKVAINLAGKLGNEKSDDILGDSWYYGIVADDFTFNGEAETNFAVKNLIHKSGVSGGQTGITDKGAGSKKAWFVAGSVDSPFMVKGVDANITTTKENKDYFINSTTTGNEFEFGEADKDTIDEYIDDIRNDAKGESNRLAELDSVGNYNNLPQNQMTIDITAAGSSTVYLNADRWTGLKNMLPQSSGVTIVKNPNQKVVINYPESIEVTTQKIVIKQNGKQYDSTALANTSTKNNDAIAQDVIYNMPKAEKVNLYDTTGIILAPNAEVHCYGVDGGWINCKHMVNECEWHFVNGYLPESKVLGVRRSAKKMYAVKYAGEKQDQGGSEETKENSGEETKQEEQKIDNQKDENKTSKDDQIEQKENSDSNKDENIENNKDSQKSDESKEIKDNEEGQDSKDEITEDNNKSENDSDKEQSKEENNKSKDETFKDEEKSQNDSNDKQSNKHDEYSDDNNNDSKDDSDKCQDENKNEKKSQNDSNDQQNQLKQEDKKQPADKIAGFIPKTGDNTDLGLAAVELLGAGAALAVIAKKRKNS